MASRRKIVDESPDSRRRPATTPEGDENQMIVLAGRLAEKQLREGTASAQVISHFLKLGSTREKLEQDRIASENELLKAKVANLASQGDMNDLYKKAIQAMSLYSGQKLAFDEEDDD